MRRRLIGAWVAALWLAAGLCAQTLEYRVLAKGEEAPRAVEGRLWLYAGGWGWLNRVELGRVEGGDLRIAVAPALIPDDWPPEPYRGYLAAFETDEGLWFPSSMHAARRDPPAEGFSREMVLQEIPSLIAETGALQTLGSGGKTLVLPKQGERRITLLHEDGTPLAGERLNIDVYVWRQNHCGVAVGLGRPIVAEGLLGSRTTDDHGTVIVRAPDAPLFFRRRHYPVVDSGFGGTLREDRDAVEIPPGSDVTVQTRWERPESVDRLEVRLSDPSGQPISGWYAAWDQSFNTCGPPIFIEGPSDTEGRIQFGDRGGSQPELTRSLTIYDSDVREGGSWDTRLVHRLTREELLRLAGNGSIGLTLERPAP